MTKKKKKKIRSEQQNLTKAGSKKLNKIQYQLIGIGFIVLVLMVYFSSFVFEGLSPIGTDVVHSIGQTHQIKGFENETGEKALWNPYLFSGLPIYYRLTSKGIALDQIIKTLSNTSGRNAFIHYTLGAIGLFLLTQFWGIPIWGSILASLAFVFMPHYEALVQAGHYQKFRAIMIIPWMILSFQYLLKKSNLWSPIFFTIILSWFIRTKHYQIMFYTMLLLIFLGISHLIQMIKNRNNKEIFLRLGLLSIGLVFALLMSIQSLWPVRDYLPYSMRGGTGEKTSKGLEYDYATRWSWSPKEMLSLLIPNAFGGSSSITYKGNDVPQLKGRQIPGYWGDMPFTEGGDYLGILAFIFAVIGMIYGIHNKNHLIITFTIFIIFAFLLSFGRHFPVLYQLFFNTVPVFNKFRIPCMILMVIYFSFAFLAGFGFKTIYESSQEKRNNLIKPVIIIGGLLLFLSLTPFLLKPLFSFEKLGEANQYSSQVLELIKDARYDLMKQDAIRLLIISALGIGILFIFLKTWINRTVFSICIITLLLIDLIPMNRRFLNNLGKPELLENQYFRETPTDKFLLRDKSLYRIFPLEQNVFQNNNWSYYHQNIGGYHPAKLRIYQDIIEFCIYNGWDEQLPINWNILNMLNGKYIISPQKIETQHLELENVNQQMNQFIYQNKNVLPRAFFVGDYEIIENRLERFNRLNSPEFDPGESALLEYDPYLEIEKPDSSNIQIVDFTPNTIELDVYTNKNSLLVLSEIFYPKGWRATIDEKETEIFKTNHILRSIVIPRGNHHILFEFLPKSFYTSRLISGISNVLVYLFVIGLSIYTLIKNKQLGK